MAWLSDPQTWASLLTLTALEVVLGIDNLALGLRLALLAAIAWVMRLTEPLFAVAGWAFSWRDLILIGGGLFLVYKGTGEIHERIEGGGARASLVGTVAQIAVLDIVFSLDSVITAVG